jgi:hypothetical protein
VNDIDILRLKPGSSARDQSVNREQNILDAESLPVNRLAFKRILSAGWQIDVGGLTGQIPKKSYVLAARARLIFG